MVSLRPGIGFGADVAEGAGLLPFADGGLAMMDSRFLSDP
jgi:hypothetical protein